MSFLENRRINLENSAHEKYEDTLRTYNNQKQEAYNNYLSLKKSFEDKQNNHNSDIIRWKTNFELGIPEAVENYINMVLSDSHYPEEFTKEFIAFDPNPITGSKFIIQAKRYNNVVPASAARDLYGALIK